MARGATGEGRAGVARRCPVCDEETTEAVCPKDRAATLLVVVPAIDAHELTPGAVIAGRYAIERPIGRGKKGAVFAARHTATGQEVALKLIEPKTDDDGDSLRQFFLDARVFSGLKHPSTMRLLDLGQDDSGLVFLAMELLEGRSLRDKLLARQMSEKDLLVIAIDVTRSLQEAHSAGLTHRDLTPDNIFVHDLDGDEPAIKVLDYGVTKLGSKTSDDTIPTRALVPQSSYASPEQLGGGPLDARSDLYSLGAILHEAVTSAPPPSFTLGAPTAATIQSRARVLISAAFAAAISRALSPDPDDRFQQARQMRLALEALLKTTGDRVTPARNDEGPTDLLLKIAATPPSVPSVSGGSPAISDGSPTTDAASAESPWGGPEEEEEEQTADEVLVKLARPMIEAATERLQASSPVAATLLDLQFVGETHLGGETAPVEAAAPSGLLGEDEPDSGVGVSPSWAKPSPPIRPRPRPRAPEPEAAPARGSQPPTPKLVAPSSPAVRAFEDPAGREAHSPRSPAEEAAPRQHPSAPPPAAPFDLQRVAVVEVPQVIRGDTRSPSSADRLQTRVALILIATLIATLIALAAFLLHTRPLNDSPGEPTPRPAPTLRAVPRPAP